MLQQGGSGLVSVEVPTTGQ